MFTIIMLATAVCAQDSWERRHVRAIDPKIPSLIEIGRSGSATFRRLFATLEESDVIVYVEPKLTRHALGGYLAHNIVAAGDYRYLHVAIDTSGSQQRLASLIAHELQHAVEVAQSPAVRDARSLEHMFSRLAIAFGCGETTCFGTQAARDVEGVVKHELAASQLRSSTWPSSPERWCAAAMAGGRAPRVPVRCAQDVGHPAQFHRVRSSDPLITALIEHAASLSATFQRLLVTVEASNGIVYVESGACGHGVRACLKMWMHVSGPNRFLRILVDQRRGDSDIELTGSIGHELAHAIEALSQPNVTDGLRLYSFFRQYAPTDNNRFETTAALKIGDAIRDELQHREGCEPQRVP